MLDVGLVGSLLINVVSSVGVIMINKRLVFMEAGFQFGTVLTIIHFFVTFAGCVFFSSVGVFQRKKLPLGGVFPISCAFCGYVVFNNLSLLTNSVSVYQVSKIFCTPVIVLLDAFVYGKRERKQTLLALVPVCVGVFVTVFTDADLNLVGSMWCLLAIIANSFYTIWGKTKQDELGAKPMQLLLYQAPMSAFMLLFVAGPLDGVDRLSQYTVTFTTVWTVALSCVFAFGVNFSFFLFVGKTSPLTMNVVGYLKTALVFIFGFIFVDSEVNPKTILGVGLTLFGLAWYTYAKVEEAKLKEEARNKTQTSQAEKDVNKSFPVVFKSEEVKSPDKAQRGHQGAAAEGVHVAPVEQR